MIKVVVFDLDDTLYPEHRYVLSGFRAVDKWLEDVRTLSGFFPAAEAIFLAGKRGNIFNLALDQLGVAYKDEDIRQLLQVYREHRPELSLYKDAAWAIDHFKDDKYLGIITDGYLLTQKNKVAALGLDKSFNAIVYSDEFGRENWKPSKVPYQKIMELSDCRGDECVYIADNPVKDFVTAKKLKWQTIQVFRENGEYNHFSPDKEHEAEVRINSLVELEKMIE